ncbi:MAG: hypothetical protein GY851_05200 [bacterium]|nr:hypothetical protein [bacterium]
MRYLPLALIVLAAGCLSQPTYVPTTRYTLAPEIPAIAADATPRVLAIRPLLPARPYSKPGISFLEADHVLGAYDHAEWAELPAASVTRALADALIASGRFQDVGDALNVTSPDLILTGQLRRFDEVRTAEPRTAVCEIRLELREARSGKCVWADTITASVALDGQNLPALAAAMSKAVSTVVSEAATHIAAQ